MSSYVGPSMSLRTVIARADAAGVQVYRIGPATDKRELLASFARVLRFPAYFGANYDALADCLRDLSWLPSGPKLVVWDRAETLRGSDPTAFAVVDDILAEAERADLAVTVILR